jgi:dTDP-4-dehydrorhamnose reductase
MSELSARERLLVTGASGQLAGSFVAYGAQGKSEVSAPPEAELDITSRAAIERAFETYRPTVLVNCAAYNNVDGAEADPQAADLVNRDAVATLSDLCAKHAVKFVHYGSDYVFDGTSGPYTEEDTPKPLNRYGASKLAGEQAALKNPDALVFRTSWVYGPGEQNFLFKLRQWSEGHAQLKVVADQISTPTYTVDIVTATLEAIRAGLSGLYHLVNHGYASRIDVARAYFEAIGRTIDLEPVPTSHFPSPATRPLFSALLPTKLEQALGHELPTWQDAITRYAK